MKNLLCLSFVMLTMFATSAFAKDNYARRYKTTYSSFDSGFNHEYQYREHDQRCRYNTCLGSTFSSTDTVYIEETVIYDRQYGEQRMVRVYESERYETHIVTYYVQNEGRRSHVRARRYNEQYPYYHNYYYYYTPYVMPGLVLTAAMMNDFDSQSATLLLAGGVVFDLGLNIASSCRTQECLDTAGSIALLGVASSAFASISNAVNKANEKTELENQIRSIESSDSNNVR